MQGTAKGRQWLGGTKVPFTASSPGHKIGEIPDIYPNEGHLAQFRDVLFRYRMFVERLAVVAMGLTMSLDSAGIGQAVARGMVVVEFPRLSLQGEELKEGKNLKRGRTERGKN